jgi:hypothetical protein
VSIDRNVQAKPKPGGYFVCKNRTKLRMRGKKLFGGVACPEK